jgi:hypothetical protein
MQAGHALTSGDVAQRVVPTVYLQHHAGTAVRHDAGNFDLS